MRQTQLNRPIGQLRDLPPALGLGLGDRDLAGEGRGACKPDVFLSLCQMLFHRLGIESARLAFIDAQCPGRALSQTGSQPIAERVANDLGLPIPDLDRSFRAGDDALAASIAQRFIDIDYLSGDQVLALVPVLTIALHIKRTEAVCSVRAFDHRTPQS